MRRILTLLAVVAVPIAEIWLFAFLGKTYGWGPVIVLAAVQFGFGLAMVPRAMRAWGAAIERAGTDPGWANTGFGPAMGNAGLLFAGALMMIVPGFITGFLGLLLVIPPVRHLVQRIGRGRIDQAAAARGYGRVTVIEGETVSRTPTSDTASDVGPASGAAPGGGSGAPGRPMGAPSGWVPEQTRWQPEEPEAAPTPGEPKVITGEVVSRDDDPRAGQKP
ncbi:MAG: hypothetical protein RLZ55_1296 [Actinomycetota bacterium]|jgi:UPF0716 protein FxsA